MNCEDEHSALDPDTAPSTESVRLPKPGFFEERPPQVIEVAPSFCAVGLGAIFCSSVRAR